MSARFVATRTVIETRSNLLPLRGKVMVMDDSFIVVPVKREAVRVIWKWVQDHADDLDRRLQRFGLRSTELAMPEWERVVLEREAPEDGFGGIVPRAARELPSIAAAERGEVRR